MTGDCAKTDEVKRRLAAHYGVPQLHPNGDPLASLMQTILSQHTTDASADRAYVELRKRYPDWCDVEAAPTELVIEAIRSAGLAKQKAETIQAALRSLTSNDLAHLGEVSVAQARARLTMLRGVGEKTASCVLLFALGMPAQPVDTHVQRVSTRLGIAGREAMPTGIQRVLESCLPAEGQSMFAFHVTMVRHGREICTARAPKCAMCFLNDICDYYAGSKA